MPRPSLFAVRSAVELSDKQSHRLVLFAAMDDITGLNRRAWQWTHPQLARQLGVAPEFVSLVQGYLEYRRTRNLDQTTGIRLHGRGNAAQLYRVSDGSPLDLVRISGGDQYETRMAALFREAMSRKIRIDTEVVSTVELNLGRSCLIPWPRVTDAYRAQRTAQDLEVAV